MKKVAKFIRTSTDLQHSSIDNQDDILNNWIENRGYKVYKTYTDEGISGTKKVKRIQWLEMLENAKNKEFNILVCKSYSRFGRNQIESLEAIRVLRENDIRVVFLEDNLDSDVDTSRFGLMAWLAEEESKRTSTRIKGVQKHFREIGKIYNCIPPYGYDYSHVKKNFVINPTESEIVKRIFKLYLKGNGTNKIANILEGDGVASKNGGRWRGNTIKNIILNEAYIGTLVQGKTSNIDVTINKRNSIPVENWIKHLDNHEAIIDRETFIKANEIFKINSDKSKKFRYSIKGAQRSSNKSLFSNLLKCSCGASLTIRRKANRKSYYNCSEYEKVGTSCGHSSNFVQENFLIEYVKVELDELVASNFETINIKSKQDIRKSLKKELEIINKQIDKQLQLSNSLLELYSNNQIKIEQFKLQNESIGNILSNLITNKKIIENKLSNVNSSDTNNFKKTVKELTELPVNEWENIQLKEVIESIEVNLSGKMKIDWNIDK